MRKIPVLLGIFLALFSPPLAGDDRTQDGEFALELLRRGYVELAIECAKNILKGRDFVGESSVSRGNLVKGAAFYVLVQAKKYYAERARTEKERKKYLAEYEKLLKEFQRKYKDHPYALNASLNLLLTHRTEAVRMLVKARLEPDLKKKRQKILEGYKAFKKVIQDFQKLIQRYQKRIDKEVQKKMKELRAKEKDPFAREEIDEFYTMQYLARNNTQFYNLLYRRVMAEYLLGETALLFVRWQERLKIEDSSSKYLDLAYKSFRKIEIDFPHFESIYAKAGLGAAEVLMRRGESKAAIDKYDGLTLFRFSYYSPNPSEMDQQRAYEKEIATEAVYGLASVWLRLKKYQNAIIVVDKMFERYPDALSTYGGRMALLAKCEALTLKDPPEPQKAMAEAYKVVEWSRKKEKPVPGRDFGKSALLAAVRMSEIREKIKGPVEFPPGISLMIATGFFETGKYEWAIYSYKDVLSSPLADEESVVMAIKGLGNCYYNTKRYEEAAIAYAGVLERFPHRGQEAVKLARQALKILSDRFGPEDEAVREFKEALEDRLGGASTYYNRGLEYRQQAEELIEKRKIDLAVKRLQQAIESLEKVEKRDPNGRRVSYYGDAQATLAESLYLIGKLKGDESKQREAIRLLEERIRELSEQNDLRGWAACAYQLGRIYLEKQKYKKALKVLLPFQDKLRSISTYASSAKALMIRCAVALGKNEIAEKEYNELLRSEGKNSAKTAQAAYLLVDTYYQFVEREKAKIRNIASVASLLESWTNIGKFTSEKNLRLYVLEKNEKGVFRYRIALERAAKYAVDLYEYYKSQNKGEFSLFFWLGGIALSAKDYQRAIPILRDALRSQPKVEKNGSGDVTETQRLLFLAKRYLAEALLGYGKRSRDIKALEEAKALFEELVKDDRFKRSIYLRYRAVEGLAETLDALAQLKKDKGLLAKAIEAYKDFQGLLLQLVQQPYLYSLVKKPEDSSAYVRYYEVTYRFFELLYQMGNYRDCYEMIKTYRDRGSDFGTPELREKFLWLMEQAKRRTS